MPRARRERVLAGFLKPVAILLFLVAFFVFYNAYLVDKSLEILNISLEETVNAQSAASIEDVSMLLRNALLNEVSKPDLDLTSITALDLASTIANESQSLHQLKTSQAAIQMVVKKKTDARFFLLQWLDRINHEMQRIFFFVEKMVMRLVKGAIEKPKPMVRYDLVRQAKELERSGSLEEARKAYAEFIGLNRGAEGIGLIITRLAFVEMKLGRYEEAKNSLAGVTSASNSTEIKVARNLKLQIDKLEKLQKERVEFTKRMASIQDPQELQQAYYQLGLMSMELYDLKGSQEALKKSIDLDPTSETADKARFNLGFAYKMASQIKESADIFTALSQKAVSSDYQTASAIQLASTKQLSGDFVGAAKLLEEVSKTSTSAVTAVMTQYGAGYVYLYNLNDLKQSQEAFEAAKRLAARDKNARIIEIQRYETVPLREYAFDLFEHGKFPEAKDAFMTVLKTDKNDAWSHSGLALIYQLEGDRQKAAEFAERGYKIEPDYYTTAALAYVEEQLEHLDRAVELNKRSIKDKSDYLYPYYNLGHIYLTQEKYQLAMNILKQGRELAVKLGKKFPLLQTNLGYSYFHLQEFDKAIEMFNEAIKIDPNLVDAWYDRALVYEEKGDKVSYERDMKRAFTLNPQFKDIKDRIAKQAA